MQSFAIRMKNVYVEHILFFESQVVEIIPPLLHLF